MTYPNNVVPLLDPDISSTNSLGGIAPGKSKLGSWGAPQSEICDIFTPGALDAAPHFSLVLGLPGGQAFVLISKPLHFTAQPAANGGRGYCLY
jgi:hypothetical protein